MLLIILSLKIPGASLSRVWIRSSGYPYPFNPDKRINYLDIIRISTGYPQFIRISAIYPDIHEYPDNYPRISRIIIACYDVKKKKGEWTLEPPRVVTRSSHSFSDLLDR